MADAVRPGPWTAAHFAMTLGMWAVMMVGMMLPAAAPMVLFFATFSRRSREQGHNVAPVGAFVSGYVAVWSAFALAATTLQWGAGPGGAPVPAHGRHQPRPGRRDPDRRRAVPVDAAQGRLPGPLPLAGRLRHGALAGLGRAGRSAWGGARAFCVGCCWALMGLLFVGGVMNLLWVAAITVAVLAEKLAPRGGWIARAGGVALVLGGAWVIAAGIGLGPVAHG
jgi:predicted metal-binding membrane protein